MSNPQSPELTRERLLQRRAELLQRVDRVASDMRRDTEPLSADAPDQAIQRENDDVLLSIGAAAKLEIVQLEAALRRLAEGRYGICESCGEQISAGRLESIPYTSRCARCADSVPRS
jgi:RNA polymerase-binding protein DksA